MDITNYDPIRFQFHGSQNPADTPTTKQDHKYQFDSRHQLMKLCAADKQSSSDSKPQKYTRKHNRNQNDPRTRGPSHALVCLDALTTEKQMEIAFGNEIVKATGREKHA